MATTLNPAPRSLGLHSPVLGPWFSTADVTLPLPDADLACSLTIGDNVEWRPPAGGLFSLYVASATRPAGLSRLRAPSGAPAFTNDRLVAVFELLPEVSERLGALMRVIPTAGNPAVANLATRPPIRTLAIEFNEPSPSLAFLTARLPTGFAFPATVTSDADKLTYLGLAAGAVLMSGPTPMRDLFRPGVTAGSSEVLLRFPADTPVRLWTFDGRGRAVDPGAAACWWLFLATQATVGFVDLFAQGIDAADQRTCSVAPGADRLTVQLCNAHEGPLDPAALARLTIGGNVDGTDSLRFRGAATDGGVDLSFTDAAAGAPDDLPTPRMAVLPDGRLGASLSLFPTGAMDPLLRRDQVRVAVLSVEHQLIGQPRSADTSAPEPVRRRAADQERASTRQLIGKAARPALLLDDDAVAAAAVATLSLVDGATAVPARLVAPAMSLDFGPLTATPADVAVPTSLTMSVQALVGGGAAVGSTVVDQRVLLRVDLGAAAAGAWLRAWSQGFDPEKGERFRLDGGAAFADTTGRVRLVLPLPTGSASSTAPLGVDLLVVTAQGSRLFADQRFERPSPVGGAPVAASAAVGPILLAEEGREVPSLTAGVDLRPGTTAVALGGSPTRVDPASIPIAARQGACFARAAAAGDTLRLTQPAFPTAPVGDAEAALGATGATVRRTARRLPAAWQAGFPLPGMERHELLGAATTANVSRAFVGGGAALGLRHGRGAHHDGHPGGPASDDLVSTGVDLQGPAVLGLAEFAIERGSTDSLDLATSAADAAIVAPAEAAAHTLWAAGLRTVAAGVEAEVGLAALFDLGLGDAYPFGQTLTDIRDFLSGVGLTLPATLADPAGRVARALDRRFLAAAHGAREGATALLAAVRRAEDLVYIETPALDDKAFGGTDDTVDLLGALVTRMAERPGLVVVLCLPVFYDSRVPKPLQRVRDAALRRALDTLQGGGREARVAVFSPSAGPGRTLKLATTTVIVDDAWCLVGSTHLWRRGLSYDASYAVALFDDELAEGRPRELLDFRRRLTAKRLGVAVDEVPTDPVDLCVSVRIFVARGGFGRLAADRLRPPEEATTSLTSGTFTEADVWNPDGSPPAGLNPLVWALQLTPTAVTESFTTP